MREQSFEKDKDVMNFAQTELWTAWPTHRALESTFAPSCIYLYLYLSKYVHAWHETHYIFEPDLICLGY
jgi:hypothetical protein